MSLMDLNTPCCGEVSPQRSHILLSLLLLTMVALSPLLFFVNDLWDGSIISYAFDSKKPTIFDTWFMETGSPLVALVYKMVYNMANGLGIHIKVLINVIIMVAIYGCALEIYRIGRGVFKFGQLAAFAGGALFVLNPAWHILVSSIFLSTPLWIYMCLVGVRLVLLSNQTLVRGVGGALVLVSCHYAANPVLSLPLLFYGCIGRCHQSNRQSGLLFIGLSIVYFFLFRWYVPSNGLYNSYNSVTLNHLFTIEHYQRFGLYVVKHYWPMLLLSCYLIKRLLGFKLLFFLLFILATILPFVIVGKSVSGYYDWSSRFTVILTVALSFSLGFLLNQINWTHRRDKWVVWLFAVISFIVVIVNLYQGYAHKAMASAYQSYVIAALKKMTPPEAGVVHLRHGSHYTPDSYEWSYYFYQAFGRAKWYVNLRDDLQQGAIMTASQDYRDKYVASDFRHKCSYSAVVEDNIDQLSGFDAFLFLIDKAKFIASNKTVFVNIKWENKGCVNDLGLDHVDVNNQVGLLNGVTQSSIAQCQQFWFKKGPWNIMEPLVFDPSCEVRFFAGAQLFFAKDAYMVVQGSVYFPESKGVVFDGIGGAPWGGILISSPTAHVQYAVFNNASSFDYNGQHHDGALNIVGSEHHSIYRCVFNHNSSHQGLKVHGGTTRISETTFIDNQDAVTLDNVDGVVINNVILNSRGNGINFINVTSMTIMRNIIDGSAGNGFMFGQGTKVNSYYNLLMNNQVALKVDRHTSVVLEGDLLAKNHVALNIANNRSINTVMSGSALLSENGINYFDVSRSIVQSSTNRQPNFTTLELTELTSWATGNFSECPLCLEYIKGWPQ